MSIILLQSTYQSTDSSEQRNTGAAAMRELWASDLQTSEYLNQLSKKKLTVGS